MMCLNHRSVYAGIPYSFHLSQGSRHFKCLPLCQSSFTKTGNHIKTGENHALWKDKNKYTIKKKSKEHLYQCGGKEGFQNLFLSYFLLICKDEKYFYYLLRWTETYRHSTTYPVHKWLHVWVQPLHMNRENLQLHFSQAIVMECMWVVCIRGRILKLWQSTDTNFIYLPQYDLNYFIDLRLDTNIFW